MTFSLIARDPETGSFGMAVTSSSPSVAARCIHLRAGVGAAASQNVTDPALGPALLDLIDSGATPLEAMTRLTVSRPHIAHRQLALVDAAGRTAAFSGARTLGTHKTVQAEGAVAAGNLLSRAGVVDAIMDAYLTESGPFEARLIAALAAGRDAGGEEGPEHSAGVVVVGRHPWPVTDLRVDWAEEDPVGALAELWDRWEPQKIDYATRAVDPEAAPSYGVPGDL